MYSERGGERGGKEGVREEGEGREGGSERGGRKVGGERDSERIMICLLAYSSKIKTIQWYIQYCIL